MTKLKKTKLKSLAVLITVGLLAFALVYTRMSEALPSGAAVDYQSNETNNGTPPGSRADPGGYIVWLNLDTIQQNTDWKAYVGNVSGKLTLDDASNNTIYDWTFDILTGEVYVTRNSSVSFSSINCSNSSAAWPGDENAYFGWSAGDVDSVNATFNYTTHPEFSVGTRTFAVNSCPSLYTYQNDTRQADLVTSDFPQVVMVDENDIFVYVALLEDGEFGFDEGAYDFQIIVPENGSSPTPTTYYFYVELG